MKTDELNSSDAMELKPKSSRKETKALRGTVQTKSIQKLRRNPDLKP